MTELKGGSHGVAGTGVQADLELDPRDVDHSLNQAPEDMPIDPARLFEQATEQTRMALCVTDPHRPGNPIVFVNQAFVELTGYQREEIIGRNCKFLQGPDTDPRTVEAMRDILERQAVEVIEVLNYRKDGTPFWNSLHLGPIFDDANRLTHFYGSQWDVTEVVSERARGEMQRRVNEELQHRTRNLFGVIGSIVRQSARGVDDVGTLVAKVTERIDAMGRAHDVSISPGGETGQPGDLHALSEAILRPYRTEAAGRIGLDGPVVAIPTALVTPLGLVLHELATNAVKHGALGVAGGQVRLDWTCEGRELVLNWTESGGPRPEAGTPGTGSRLMRGVLSAASGRIETELREGGLRAVLHLPL